MPSGTQTQLSIFTVSIMVNIILILIIYFSDVADAILESKREIFITGWWLVPKLYPHWKQREEEGLENTLV